MSRWQNHMTQCDQHRFIKGGCKSTKFKDGIAYGILGLEAEFCSHPCMMAVVEKRAKRAAKLAAEPPPAPKPEPKKADPPKPSPARKGPSAEEQILGAMESEPDKKDWLVKDIMGFLRLPKRSDRQAIRSTVHEMVEAGKLKKEGKYIRLPKRKAKE